MTSPMNNQLAKGVDVRNTRLWHNDIARRVANLERQSGKLATPGGVKMYRGSGKADIIHTNARITVHWLGHTFSVPFFNVPTAESPYIWLRVTRRDGSSLAWKRSDLTTRIGNGQGAAWPAQGDVDSDTFQQSIFPLCEWVTEGAGGYIRYIRNHRYDATQEETIFDAVTIQDEPVGSMKIWRSSAPGLPVGWDFPADHSDFTGGVGRVMIPSSGESVRSTWVKTYPEVDGDTQLMNMQVIQRLEVPDDS